MPPKSQAPGQPTISSFFTKKAADQAPSAPSASATCSPSGAASPPHAAATSSTLGRRQPNGDHIRSDDEDEPPIKRVRPPTAPSKPSSSSRDRVEQWRFTPRSKQAALDESTEELPLPTSSQRSAHEEERHNTFRKKLLGDANPIVKWDQAAKAAEREEGGDGAGEDGEGGADEDDDESQDKQEGSSNLQRFASNTASRAGSNKGKGKNAQPSSSKVKYTPLELQVLDLKAKHPDVLLLFEVGYKFIAYEEDAVNASKELNVMCFPKQNMRIASIPVHRLHIHARRLIKAGYKVGVVRQTETRALKAASSNSSKPFTRSLTELYTASTWVEDLETVGGDESGMENPVAQNSLVALVEKMEGSDERVSIGLIAVQAATGAVVYDQFMDSSMRSELETRLAHLQPAELLLPPLGKLSKSTEKLIRYLAGNPSTSSSVGIASTRLRVERTESLLTYNEAFNRVTSFYEEAGQTGMQDVNMADGEGSDPASSSKQRSVIDDASAGATIATVMKLPPLTVQALAACISHLKSFGLASMFKVTGNFVSFQARSEMLLSTGTLHNLELFATTEGTYKGSLCWLLDKCKTIFGKRTLRRWIARPLTDVKRLEERMDAVSEMLEGKDPLLSKVPELLTKQPDLEKGLARMLYGRATTNEVATILLALNRITHQFEPVPHPGDVGLKSSLLNESIAALPRARSVIKTALQEFNVSAARKGEKENLFPEGKFPELQDEKDQISLVEADLEEHLIDLRKQLKRPTLQYATVSGIDYLVEVRVGDAKKVPADWLRISATKSVVRFHTPEIIAHIKRRDQHRERLEAKAKEAFSTFLDELCEHSTVLRNTISALGNLDALTSLASVAALPGYTRPVFVPESEGDVLHLTGLRHPMSEALRDDYVPNDIQLGNDGQKGVVLTGANMGGKSSTVRAIALCVVLAQVGCFVPASEARLSIRDAVLTRMGASDELAKGRSTFMVEAEEAAEILRVATSRSLVILDELGRGTSTFDGQAIASSVLSYLMTRETHRQPTTLFITHYTSLCTLAERLSGVRNMHMAFVERANPVDGEKEVVFLYQLREGPASSSFGIHCAALAGLPRAMLEVATERAEKLKAETERRMRSKRNKAARRALKVVFGKGDGEELEALKRAALKLGVIEMEGERES